jgi:hypothetical protein
MQGFRVNPARFGNLSARLRNPASQVCRSRAVTFLRFPAMQRTSEDVEDRLDVSELIERISVERDLPFETTGRHRLLDPDTRRSRTRRLAPAIAGVTTVLVATTVAVTLRPGDTAAGPELDAALVGASSAEPPKPAAEEVPAPVETPAVADDPTSAPPTTARAAAASTGTARKPAAQPAANDGTQAAAAHGWKGPVRRAGP